MISPQDSLTVVPNNIDIINNPQPPMKGVPTDIGTFGGQSTSIPPQEGFDLDKSVNDFINKPASLGARVQPIEFNWQDSNADRFVNSEYLRTEGFHPYSGSVVTPDGTPYDYNEQHYGQIQTFGNAMKNAAGGFWNLTKSTFSDSIEGTGRLFNALFSWDSTKLIGTPEELALKDEEQKAIFNKYAVFHTPERDKSIINQQFLGDIITQAGFAIGPTAEFVLEQALTMGASSLLSGFAKGTKFAVAGLRAAEMAKRAMPVAESINDGRKLGSMTANTNFFKEMVGGLKQGAKWTAKQLNPITGIQDIQHAVEAGTGAWNVGITTVGAAKRMFGQANMAFNEARFEAAGTYGQMVGDLISKFEEQTGRSPEGAELDNIQKYAYGAATDNFIANSGIIMAMNTLQFGNMFSKFSTSSKLLREAIETGSDTYAVTGEIGGKAATRVYKNSGIFANPVRTFNNIRRDFGVGTALYTVGKRAITGTAAKFELSEGVQELLQTGSDNAIREYYTNLYDGRKDINGANILDANWQKAMTDQYNMDGWKTFLMGAVTGMLISPVQASVMYAAKKGYGKFNEEYKAQDDAYQKTLDDNIKLQNTFYENVNKGLNEAIKNWKIQAYASKTMEEALQSGDKYTFFNAKDDSFASTVNAAIKTNTLPALVNAIKEQTTAMSSEELAEAYPALVPADGNTDGIRNTLVQVANDIEQYNNNWESLKEQYGHLVMPEVYKANKEEYKRALLAKRALDEAIELIATTDYKAKRAITRATEIKNKIAAIQGLGQSAAEAFDTLLSDARTALKIQELSQLIAATEGIEQDKEQQQLTNSRKEQVEHLLTWNTLMQIRSTISEQNTSEDITELNDKLADAFKKYIVAHNKITGPYTDVIDTSALQGMFNEFGQYMALNRDYGHYIEALNIIADPKNFEKSYAIIRGALEYANDKLKEENIKESKKKIDAEFGVQEEEVDIVNESALIQEKLEQEDKKAREKIAEKLQEIEDKKRSLSRQKNIEQAILDQPFILDIPSFDKVRYYGEEGYLEYDEESNTLYFNSVNGRSLLIEKVNGGYNEKAFEYGIFPVEDSLYNAVSVSENEDGNLVISIYGNDYINLYTDPLKAINRDTEGNVISVDLNVNDKNKAPRNFKGEGNRLANIIAYQILLYTYAKEQQSRAKTDTTNREINEGNDNRRKEQVSLSRDTEEQKSSEKEIVETKNTIEKLHKEEEETLLIQKLIDAKTLNDIENIESMLTSFAKEEYSDIIELAKEKIQNTEREEVQEESEPEVVQDVDSFVDRITRGEDMSSPEDVQFYDNNKKEIEQKLAEKAKATQQSTNTGDMPAIDETIEIKLPNIQQNTPIVLNNYTAKISTINDMITIVPKPSDKDKVYDILSTVPKDQLRLGMRMEVVRNTSSVKIVEVRPNAFAVIDNRFDTPERYPKTATDTYSRDVAEQKVAQLLGPKAFGKSGDFNPYIMQNAQEYSIKVYYEDTLLGYMREPDAHIFNFGQGPVPVQQLTDNEVQAVLEIPRNMTLTEAVRVFKDNYSTAMTFKEQLNAIMSGRDTIELVGNEIPILPVVGEGSINVIPETEYQSRKLLSEHMEKGTELLAIYDKAQETMIFGSSDMAEEALKVDKDDILGNYKIKVKLANGATKWLQGKGRVYTDAEIQSILDRVISDREKVIAMTKDGEVPQESDVAIANSKLESIFITTVPETDTKFYMSLSPDGRFRISRVTGKGKTATRNYLSYTTTIPSTPDQLRTMLTKEIRKELAKNPTGVDPEIINTIEVKPNNLRVNIPKQVDVEYAADNIVLATGDNILRNIKLTYINDKNYQRVEQDGPSVTQVANVDAPIQGGSTFVVPTSPVQSTETTADTGDIDLGAMFNDSMNNVPKKKGKKGRKVITTEDKAAYVEGIDRFREWIVSNLPQISVEETEGIIERLQNGNTTVGEFVMSVLNTGKLQGTIRTSPQAAYKYHEAFHSLFRMFLPQDRIDTLLAQAERESPATYGKLQAMRELHEEYAAMEESELVERYYEEYLADKFDAWMKNRNTPTSNVIKEFFNKLWNFIKEIAARITGNDISRLFYEVNRGKFKNVAVQPNQFTQDTELYTTAIAVKKVIPIGVDKETGLTRYIPQSKVESLVGNISAMFFQMSQSDGQKSKREILEEILDLYKDMYDYTKPRYRELANAITDPGARKLWYQELIDLAVLFNNEDARYSLMEAVDTNLRIYGLKQSLEEEAVEDIQEEVGERNTDNFKKGMGTIGDISALPLKLRMYIAGTTRPFVDEYGNQQLKEEVRNEQGEVIVPAIPLREAVNPGYVYNGLLKLLSNSTTPTQLIGKLWRARKYGNNPDTTEFLDTLVRDTGLEYDEDNDTFSINREGQEILIQQVIKGFGQFEVDHMFMLVVGTDYKPELVNRKNAVDNQLKKWGPAYNDIFWRKREVVTPSDRRAYSVAAIKPIEDLIAMLKNPPKDMTVIETTAREITNSIRNNLGISIHPTYVMYSVAYYTAPDVRTKDQQYTIDDYDNVDPISVEMLNTIRPILINDNLFDSKHGKTVKDVLSTMALGNSFFDETVNTISYTTADGETVYAHQLPSFYNIEIYKLNDKTTIEKDKIDPYKNSSYLLYNDNFLYLSEKNKIRMISTDGIKVQNDEGNQGNVYGDFNTREAAAYDLGMYKAARSVKKGTSSFWIAPVKVRTVEAKNSAPYVELPVIGAYINGKLSTTAMNQMIAMVKSEVDRIAKVKEEIAIGKDIVEGYHNGKRNKKDKGLSLPKEGEDTSTWATPPRGLYLFETAKMVGPLKADIEAGNIDETALKEQLNTYWNNEINRFAEYLFNEGLIGKGPNGEYVNRLAPEYLFEGIESNGPALNLQKGNFMHNLGQVFLNNFLNSTAINTLLNGNEAKLFKDSVDQVKRAAGSAGMGSSMEVVVTCPKWGITAPMTTVHHVTFKSTKGKDLFGNSIDTDDAQMYITEKALRYMLFGFGKLNQTQVDILDQLRRGDSVSAEQFYGAGGLKEKGPFNSYKLVHYDGETYIKCSALPLFRDMVSIWRDGEWYANPEYQDLHNLLDKMEEEEQRQEAAGNNIVVFAHPDTASKAMKKNVVKDIDDIGADSFNAISASYTRLQMENPSNKVVITDPTQAKQQILAEQDDSTQVVFMGSATDSDGKPWTIGAIKKMYMGAVAQRKYNNANSAANDIFDMEDAYIELQKSIDTKAITPKLGRFLLKAQETLMATGTDSHTLGFYEVDENDNPIYNMNFPSLLPKFTELFLSYFSKGVLSEKVPGTSVALVSDRGIMKYKVVTSVWRPTDKGYIPEYAGQPKTWKVVTTKEVKTDPEYYISRAKKYSNAENRTYSDIQVGDIILDTLRHNYPKYDEQGNYLGRYSEFLMPAQHAEAMESIPQAYRYMFGVRIPSDDKHSYIALEYVDTLPVQLGSVGIFPRELIRISGGDFDIDKLYIEWMDTYISGGVPTSYGTATTIEGQYDEYITWQLKNNKALKESIKEKIDNDSDIADIRVRISELKDIREELKQQWLDNEEFVQRGSREDRKTREEIKLTQANISSEYTELTDTLNDYRNAYIRQSLREMHLPVSAEEFKNRGGVELNNGVQNNRVLSGKLAMLSNDNISADTVVDGKTKASILNQSTSTDILKDLVKELKDTFTAIQNDSEVSENDKQGIPKVLEMLSDPIADTNSMLGQLLAFNNSKEGSRNIGAAVNSMLVYSILNSNNIELTSPVFFDGKQYTTFENHTTEDGIRKFAQISALVNAMTDNTKDPLAAKLGLNIEAVGYVAAMIAIGIPAKSAVLLMMQPSVREYFKTLKSLSGQLKTKDESKQSSFNLLADIIGKFPEGIVEKTLTTEDLEKNIVQGGTDKTLQLSALKLLSRVKDISEHIQKVANVVRLGKGLPTSFAEVDKILGTVSTLEDMENGETPPPFYITDVLLDKNSIIAADVNIASQVMKLSSTVFTERTPMFIAMLGRIDTLFRIPPGNNGDKIRKQIKDDLLSYLNIAAYMNKLRETETTGTLNTLHHGIIYDGQGIPTIYERVLQLREKLKSAKYPGNYLVDKYLYLVAAGESKSGINEVQSNQWAKLSAAVQERLGGAFMDLYANSYKDAVTEERIDTHSDAVALFHYLLVKDGGQFKSNSFVKYIPNEVFKELLTSAGDVNEAINNGTGDALEEVFGPEWDKLLSTFMESYAEHIGSDAILRSFYPMQETVEGSVIRGGIGIEGNNIIIDTPVYIYDKGYRSFANLGIDSKNKMTMFPLYMKIQIEGTKSSGEPYTYYDILKLVELTTDGRPYIPNYNNPINKAHRAVYIRVPARGSYAQWKGAGVYGKTPLRGPAGSYTPADNSLYTVSSPVQQISAPEQPEMTPKPQPTTWQEYLLNRGLIVSMMRGTEGTVFMVQDTNKENSRPEQIYEYSSGNANTPEELYEYLAGNRITSQSVSYNNTSLYEKIQDMLLGAKVWSDFNDGNNVKGEIIGEFRVTDGTFAPSLIVTVMTDTGDIFNANFQPNGNWKGERKVYDAYELIRAEWEKKNTNTKSVVSLQSMEPTVQQPTIFEPVVSIEPGRYVQYQDSTYIVTKQNANGTWQIYDPTKEGTAAKKSVAEKNLTPTSSKGSIVTYKDKEYIVTPKGTIISLTTNKKMEWGPENGDRRAILELAKSQGTDVDFIQFIKGKLDGSKMSNEIQGELRTNKDQLIALLGNTMYNAQLKEVVYKELLQNAFDATKIAIAKGDIRKGDVKIATDSRNRTISFTDNGVGMTPDIVQKAFFTIGGTYKGEGVSNTLKSGGLGLAKMAFIFGSERLDLKTVHNGIETTVNATSDEIRSDNFTIKTRPTNEKNGTTVTVTLPKSYVNSNGEERIIDFPEYIDIETQYSFLSKPLIGNIDIELSITNKRGDVVTKKLSGNPPEGYEKFTTAYTNWGDIDIYVDTRNVGKEYENKHEILSSGLYQFETGFKKLSGNEEIPLNMIIDIKPKVVTTNEQYPFNNQRENFRSTVLEDVNKLQHYVGLLWKIIETKMLQSSFGKMKNINPVSLETPDQNIIEQNKRITESLKVPSIESIIKDSVEEFISTEGDGTITDKGITTSKRTITTQEIKENEEKRYSSSFKAEKELKLEESTVKHNLDPYKPVVHNNTNMEINNAGMKYISEISSFMVDYKKAIIETYGEDYSPTIKDQLWGVSIDKTYGGVNVSPEMVNFLAINPFYFVPENNKVKDIVTYLAVAIDHLITHELNHNFVRSEGAEFTGRFPTTQAEMQSMPGYFELRAKLTKIVANNIETIKKLHNDYTSSKNVDSAFEANKITKDNEGSRDRRIESLPSDDTKDNDRPTEDDTRGNNRSGESLGEILRTKSTYISTIPKQEVKQMTGEQWKEQLSAIYKEKSTVKSEREWTQEALAFRNSLRGKISDNDIINKIKDCL